MITCSNLKNRPALFARMAGVNVSEFDKLYDIFKSFWEAFVREEFIDKKERKREYGGGNKPKLKLTEDKLLFILMYIRLYPIQILQGMWFDMTESGANRWIHRLTPLLERVLAFKCVLPKRSAGGRPRGRTLEEIIQEFPDLKDFLIDATEQVIRRPKNNQKQKENYSGKKKKHTKKNILLSDSKRGYVHFLGRTQPGSVHDKEAADQEALRGTSDIDIGGDLGFLGYEAGNARIILPSKKPKGAELSGALKQQNAIFSGIRIKVEHAICGVKRSRIASDTFRNTKKGYADISMLVACGLHNYRVNERSYQIQ